LLSKFVARANEVRNQLNSQAWGPDKALDEVRVLEELQCCSCRHTPGWWQDSAESQRQ